MGTSLQSETFILASASGTRRAMLESAHLTFTVDAADVDEAAIKEKAKADGKSVNETARLLAKAKATRVSARNPGKLVLAADQMLECQQRWLDKAPTMDEARKQLTFLSGKTHQLITAALLMRDGETLWQGLESATLSMRPLSDAFIDIYMQQMGESMLKSVGCYAVESIGAHLFTEVNGDLFVILGLPLFPLLKELRAMKVILS